jgi:hypothetical protein
MPPNTVYVGRGSKWGNPYIVGTEMVTGPHGDPREPMTAAEAVALYREYVEQHACIVDEHLRGRNLACWCALDQPCHADVLLELANAPR